MKKLMYFMVLTTLFACSEEVIEKPENLIPKDQMVEILYDLAIINSAKKSNPSYLTERGIEAMPFIYRRYDIDSLQFVQSDIYYASRPSEYEEIYSILEARLEKEKSEYDKYKTRVSDSIRKVAEEQRERLKEQVSKRQQQDTIP